MSDEMMKRDIALTNCILSVLRAPLRARCELHVKWWAARALNGAVYCCEGALVEVHFYLSASAPRKAVGFYAFRRGVVGIFSSFQEAEIIERAIATAEENFDAALAHEGVALLARIARLQFSVSFGDLEEHAYLAALSEKLLALFGGELRAYSSRTDPDSCPKGSAELELTLEQPRRESEVLYLLGSVWPDRIGDSLFGYGLICPAQGRSVLASCHLQITGRQF